MSISDYEPLIDRIRKRFTSWIIRTLSYAGRLLLIKSVIASITNFWCSVFKLPQRCLDHIEKMCCAFLWSGSPSVTSKAKVSWEDVCVPKSEGGLGLRKLRDTSLVFSLSLIWRLFTSTGSLWVAWTRCYLLRQTSFWDVKRHIRGSWIWNKLLKIRPIALNCLRYEVKDGRSTFFWLDNWLGSGTLISKIGDSGPSILGINRNIRVVEASTATGWSLRNHRNSLIQEMVNEVRSKQPPNADAGPDLFLWKSGDGGDYKHCFSAKDTWEQLRSKKQHQDWSKLIWFSFSIPRYAFITWLAIKDRLSTGYRMGQWGIAQSCTLCGERFETREHLFFACPYSFTVWTLVGHNLIGRTITPDWGYTFQSLLKNRRSKEDNILLRILFQSTIYSVWRERNNRIHNKPRVTPERVAIMIKKALKDRLTSRQESNLDQANALLARWSQVA